jgi:Zn-finger protein
VKSISKPILLKAIQCWDLRFCPCCRRKSSDHMLGNIWECTAFDGGYVETCRHCHAVFDEDMHTDIRSIRWRGLNK